MFLVRNPIGRRDTQTLQTPEVEPKFHLRMRRTGKTIGGLFTEVEAAGHDRHVIELNVPMEAESTRVRDDVRRPDGRRYQGRRHVATVPQNEVHQHVRKLGPEHREALDHLDAQIEAVLENLADLRTRRRAVVDRAWRAGGKVYPIELVEAADAGARLVAVHEDTGEEATQR